MARYRMDTATKRELFPSRYARKDARTRIYRALYGAPTAPDPHGNPAENDTRKLPERIDAAAVIATWDWFADLANFPPHTHAALASRMDTVLRRARRKENSE